MGLKFTYTLIAPFYDLVARRAFAKARRASLEQLPRHGHSDILLSGIGTGLDLPYLAPCHRYAALDLNRAMLARGLARAGALDIGWTQGDSMNLPFGNASFDYAVLHLILAVVPDPAQALRETARVVKPGGGILILDKFLKPGDRAPLRRLLSPLAAAVATRTDVVFEEVLAQTAGLEVRLDQPALAGGWFRHIRLEKN